MRFRKEQDFLGSNNVPEDALFGIHSMRAAANFPDDSRFNFEWYKATGTVKKACYQTCISFINAGYKRFPESEYLKGMLSIEVLRALEAASDEIANGNHFEHFIVPAVSGGAGTSINMNINEIITNRALQLMGRKPGEYDIVDPIEHANIFQSTNDVIPTALKLAAMTELEKLEHSINGLRFVIEEKEKQYRDVMRVGYTQMQAAVPSSYGLLFSNYSDALSRDWWRISKCFERIKVVNLGGSAIGTGMAVPRYFIMEVVQTLRRLTGLPVTRSENMSDTTSNLDALVEVHAVVKALAVNLEKMSSDIRLLASDIAGSEVNIPQRQVGSSVMPGKVNPVIPEYVISVAHKVYANDQTVTSLSAQGCLDLNPYLPMTGEALLNSLKLLRGACDTARDNLFRDLTVETGKSHDHLLHNAAITTVLVPVIGYNKASEIAKLMKSKGVDVLEANAELGFIDDAKIRKLIAPRELLKLGFSLKEI